VWRVAVCSAVKGALEAEAQARERAEGAAEEAGQLGFDFARTLDELKVALQEVHGGRQRVCVSEF
jgi:hypothetical protein